MTIDASVTTLDNLRLRRRNLTTSLITENVRTWTVCGRQAPTCQVSLDRTYKQRAYPDWLFAFGRAAWWRRRRRRRRWRNGCQGCWAWSYTWLPLPLFQWARHSNCCRDYRRSVTRARSWRQSSRCARYVRARVSVRGGVTCRYEWGLHYDL